MQMCCHVGSSWCTLPGASFERRATGCQSSMPGTGPRVFLCERINIPLYKMRLSEEFFTKKIKKEVLHPHVNRSTDLPIAHLPTFSHIWPLIKCSHI